MCGRDVCKPVAARAVSVSLGPSVRPSAECRRSLRSLSHTGTAAVSLAPPTVYSVRARVPSLSRWSRPSVTSALRSLDVSLEPPPPLRSVPTVSFAVCAIPSDQSDRSCRRVRSRVGCRFRRYCLRDFFFFRRILRTAFCRFSRLPSPCRWSRNSRNFVLDSRVYLRLPCNSYLPTSSHVP